MDMDIDMDIDLDLDVEDRMEDENVHERNGHGATQVTSQITLPDDPITPDAEAVPFKVHIRGLDNLSSADVKQYASEHYSTDDFVRIEWINDTSANLIYATDYVAQEALSALTDSALLNLQPADIPLLQLRPAKPLTTSTTTSLFIRLASTVDVKKKGAHEASRYYLLNPEHDPRERKGGPEHGRSRRNWASDDDGDYNRRTFDDYEHKRRRNDASNAFSVDMYDDDAGEGFTSTTSSERRKRPRRNDEDLFANRAGRATDGRLRNRSASPARQGDDTRGFGTDYESDPLAARRGARRRSRSPGGRGRNSGKELFPAAGGSSNRAAKELFTAKKELFPAKQAPAQAGGSMRAAMDLFPANSSNASKRQSFSNHRRKGAMDASGSDTAAEFFAASSTPPPPSAGERSLAERITGRPATASVDGRGGVRIRGAAAEDGKEDIGFAIRNAGRAPTVKELFPLKAGGNAGRELLGETIKGRGGRRRKAEDMFS